MLWSDCAQQQRNQLFNENKFTNQNITELESVLALDPRPAYQDDEARVYGMNFAAFDVKFTVNELQVIIQAIKCT